MQHKNYLVSASKRVQVSCICHDKPNNHETSVRRNKNLIRFLESFILLPVIAVSMPLGSIMGMAKTNVDTTPAIVLAQQNTEANSLLVFNQAMDEKAQLLKAQADAIDAYFAAHSMPLKGTGMKMAVEADKNDLDWRLLPAISVRESTGGKNPCKKVSYSYFGFGGCNMGFKSKDDSIEVVARNLGGNNPNTAKHYDGKTTKEILQKYNPPSIIPNYASQVMSIMDAIGKEDLSTTVPLAVANT